MPGLPRGPSQRSRIPQRRSDLDSILGQRHATASNGQHRAVREGHRLTHQQSLLADGCAIRRPKVLHRPLVSGARGETHPAVLPRDHGQVLQVVQLDAALAGPSEDERRSLIIVRGKANGAWEMDGV